MKSRLGSDPLVSVIVPVYNVDKDLLLNCIESIRGQTYLNLDIHVIIDGFDDSYDELLEGQKRLDSRVSYTKISHVGASGARNYGIDKSKGNYIAFVDSDDYLLESFVEEAIALALNNDADLVCGELCKTSSRNEHVEHIEISDEVTSQILETPEEIDLLKEEILSGCAIQGYESYWMSVQGPVAKLYRRSIMCDLRFKDALSIGEDVIFNIEYITRCKRAVITNRIWYVYLQREGSLCHSGSLKKWLDNIQEYQKLKTDVVNDLALSARLARLSTDMLYDAQSRGIYDTAIKEFLNLNLTNCFSSELGSRYSYPVHRRLLYRLIACDHISLAGMLISLINWALKMKAARRDK